MKKLVASFLSVLVAGAALAQGTWTQDKTHSKVGFTVTHMVVSEVEGQFKEIDVKVVSPSEDFNGADVEFTAIVASVDTESEKRDGHLKSDDFFNAEKFPQLKFKGKLAKTGDKYQLKGDLTIRDVTKPVVFDVAYAGKVKAFGGERAGFKVNGKINRFDYNLKWNKALESGSLIVADEVGVYAKLELTKVVTP